MFIETFALRITRGLPKLASLHRVQRTRKWRALLIGGLLLSAGAAAAIEQCALSITQQGQGPVRTTETYSGGGESLLLVGEGSVLSIYNVANPSAPMRLGAITLFGPVRHIAINSVGNLVAVSDAKNSIRLINVANRSAPVLLSQYVVPEGRIPRGLAIDGNTLYAAISPAGLSAINIANPSAPLLRAQVLSLGTDFVFDVKISGNRAFVADDLEGVTVWDIANPSNITALAHYPAATGASHLFISGTRAYVARRNLGYDILDISASGAPTLLGSIAQIGSYSHGALANGHLVTAAGSGGIRVFNIANVASPQLVATVSDQVNVNGVSALGNQVFVPLETASTIGFRSYSVSNPASPVTQSSVALRGRSEVLAAAGNRVYVPQSPRGLAVFDNATASRGALLGTFDAVNISNATAIGSTVFAASVVDDATTLRVLNAANPASISELTSLAMPNFIFNMAVDANHLFVVMPEFGVRIYDVTNPANLILRATWQPPAGIPLRVIASGNRAYIGGNDRVWVLDITQRDAPVLIGQLASSAATRGMALAFPFWYVSDGTDNIRVLNVSNPAVIAVAATLNVPLSGNQGLALSGARLYVAAGPFWGTVIVDISNPSAPLRVGNLPTADTVVDVAFANDTLIAAERDSGVRFHHCPPTLFSDGFE